jgi:hypothetical protein
LGALKGGERVTIAFGGIEVAYIIRGVLIGRGNTLRAELETRQAAIRAAMELREQGFEVTITDPDGKAVDETEAE